MNWIDVLLLIVFGIGVWSGFQRGLLGGAAALVSWAGSFIAAFYLYPFLLPLLHQFVPVLGVWTNAFSFIVVVLVARFILNALLNAVLGSVDADFGNHTLNRFFGIFPGAVNGLLQAIVLAALFLTLPFQNRFSDAARKSSLAATLAPPAFWLAHKLAPVFGPPLQNAFPKGSADSHEKVTLPFKVEDSKPRPDLESSMLDLINNERIKRGLKPVVADAEMRTVARLHSTDMFVRGYFAHINPEGKDPFTRMANKNVRYQTAGENLALAQTLQQAHQGLMESPGHKANILQPRFGRLGIGIMDGGIYGLMITQNFRN